MAKPTRKIISIEQLLVNPNNPRFESVKNQQEAIETMLEQKGEYTIDCRFNKKDLIRRIQRIGKYKKQIHISNLNALSLIKKIQKKKILFFILILHIT